MTPNKRYCPFRWIWPKVKSLDRSSLKRQALRFQLFPPAPLHVRSLQSLPAPPLLFDWQFGTQLATAQTAASVLLHHAKIGKGAMNKFGIFSQRRSKRLWPSYNFYQFEEAQRMNAPRLWKFRKKTPADRKIFLSAVGNCFHNCQLKNKEALGNFKGLSQDEGQTDFAKHIRVSSFNEVLSIYTRIFSQIHLDGHCLLMTTATVISSSYFLHCVS